MYHKILVPLDGSKRAEKILPHVEALAKPMSSHVLLLQVVEPEIRFSGVETAEIDAAVMIFNQKNHDAENYLKEVAQKFHDLGISAQICVKHDPVVKSILRMAHITNADLIAMTSHGRTGLARAFYGSVAAGVLHGTERALLIVRAEEAE